MIYLGVLLNDDDIFIVNRMIMYCEKVMKFDYKSLVIWIIFWVYWCL